MARLAEQTERFEDMIDYMKKIAFESQKELKDEERTLLSISYKKAINKRRVSIRNLNNFENKMKVKGSHQLQVISSYKVKVEEELKQYCNEAIELVEKTLMKLATSAEGKVFYFRMLGDYYRYENVK